MNSLNAAFIEGNIVSEVVKITSRGGTEGLAFTLASNRYFTKDGERKRETCYVEVQVWGATKKNVEDKIANGTHVRVEGSLKSSRREDGSTHNYVLADQLFYNNYRAERHDEQ